MKPALLVGNEEWKSGEVSEEKSIRYIYMGDSTNPTLIAKAIILTCLLGLT